MDMTMLRILKVTKCKSMQFEHAISISKWLTGSVHIGNIVHYLIYLPYPFPRGVGVDLEGSSIFPKLMILMHINRFCFFNHL